MILREATAADLRALHDLAVKTWRRLAIPFDTSIARFRRLRDTGHRIIVLYDSDAMLAALVAYPIETDRGPGYEVNALVVDQDHPDRLRLVDALSLYAMSIALSEGRTIVVSSRRKSLAASFYGRDLLGMAMTDRGFDLYQIGRAPEMMARIFDRHPEWQLP